MIDDFMVLFMKKQTNKALKWEQSLQCKIIYSECTFISFNMKYNVWICVIYNFML